MPNPSLREPSHAARPHGLSSHVGRRASLTIVTDTAAIKEQVIALLPRVTGEIRFANLEAPARHLARHTPDLIIISSSPSGATRALDCLRELRTAFSSARLLFLAGQNSEDLAIEAFHSGAHRYVKYPWTPSAIQQSIAVLLRPLETVSDSEGLKGGECLIGQTAPLRDLRVQIARVAATNSTVLIRGETGTGKELVAQLIHHNSPRVTKPFICINSAAIPDALLENELFGHERGAFTGATGSEVGKLGAANGGTAFLDEIGDLGNTLQAKLLRAIENKSVFRLGGSRSIDIDVRFIAATHCDLEQSMRDGRFRSDLYYRLNVLRVQVPALRDRTDDIPSLVSHYLTHFNRELGRRVAGLSRRSLDVLRQHDWPGNIRELRNVIEGMLVSLSPDLEGIIDVPPTALRQLMAATSAPVSDRDRLLRVLVETSWNKTKAAHRLRMSRMTLYRRMQRNNVSINRQGGD